jgi:hypothetical protein
VYQYFELENFSTKNYLDKGSLFILNGCINPYDNPNFENYNAPNNIEDRFQQVIASIESVKKYFPFADIAYIDNSIIDMSYEMEISSRVKYYYNVSANEFIYFSRKTPRKGASWSMELMLFLFEFRDVLSYSNLLFLNGRYQVTEQTSNNLKSFTKQGYMHVKMKERNITLIHFYFQGVPIKKILKLFRRAHICAIIGYSIEDVFSIFYFKKVYLNHLGTKGLASGISYYEV